MDKCILIVEDDSSVAQVLTRFIGSLGWDVTVAKDVAEALRVFVAGEFNLLLTDVDLGGDMDGLDVAHRLVQLDPGLRVIVMSGNPVNADRARAASLGPFIPKPLDFRYLEKLLSSAQPCHAKDSIPCRPNRILLVEDDHALREILADYLDSVGWEVVPACNGNEALQLFTVGKFKMVLSDLYLGDAMDGIEMVAKLSTMDPELKVVMTSGMSGAAEKVNRAGLGSFLSKPIDNAALARVCSISD